MLRPGSALALASALWCGLIAIALATRPLLPVDETRYLTVAWEMWQRDAWLVPSLNFAPYSDKPPLLFWLIKLVWALTGPGELAARLVGPAMALLAVFQTVALGRLLWPERPVAAGAAGLALLGSAIFMLFGSLTMFDALLTAATLLAVLALARLWRTGRSAWWLVYGLAIGLGILGKGPAAVAHMLPVALLAPLWLGTSTAPAVGSWRRWYLGLAGGLALGAGLALAWALPAAEAGGHAYGQAILWHQTADRLADSIAHARPWWFYLVTLPGLLFPWLLWPQLWRRAAARWRAGLDAGERLAWCWLLPSLLIFSLVSGKQLHYLLPALPAAALLVGRLVADAPAGRARDLWLPVTPVLLLACAAVLAPQLDRILASWLPSWPADHWLATLPSWPGAAAALAILACAWFGRRTASGQLVALTLTTMILFTASHLAARGPLFGARDLYPAAGFLRANQSGRDLAFIGLYRGELGFLSRLPGPVTRIEGEQAGAWLRAHPHGYLVTRQPPDVGFPGAQPVFEQRYGQQMLRIWQLIQTR